jgi:hypothetical protein
MLLTTDSRPLSFSSSTLTRNFPVSRQHQHLRTSSEARVRQARDLEAKPQRRAGATLTRRLSSSLVDQTSSLIFQIEVNPKSSRRSMDFSVA